MAVLEAQVSQATGRKALVLGLLLATLAGASAGCVSLDNLWAVSSAKAKVRPCQLVVKWNSEVAFAPDPAHGGRPTPGLVGRVYLFGPKIDFPLQGDGSLHVALYEDTGGEPKLREKWNLEPDVLAKFLRRDPVGMGYSIFLPWATYSREINRVIMRACYQPKEGAPIYSASTPLNVGDGPPRLEVGSKTSGDRPLTSATEPPQVRP